MILVLAKRGQKISKCTLISAQKFFPSFSFPSFMSYSLRRLAPRKPATNGRKASWNSKAWCAIWTTPVTAPVTSTISPSLNSSAGIGVTRTWKCRQPAPPSPTIPKATILTATNLRKSSFFANEESGVVLPYFAVCALSVEKKIGLKDEIACVMEKLHAK